KYQQMVRNIINSDKFAKTKIAQRNTVISEQDLNIDQLESAVKEKENLITQNEKQIAQANKELKDKMAQLKKSYKQNKITAKIYENRISKTKQEALAKLELLKNEKSNYEQQLADTQNKLGQIAGQLQNTQQELVTTSGRLQDTQGQLKNTQGQLRNTEGQLKDTTGQLAQAKAEMDTRRLIAQEIKNGFAKAGIKADVDMKTGEVLLDFGKAYFDNDSSKLKKEMRTVLEKAVPIYSKSLFGNPKISKKISAVEVIGFASPTFKGRFVDPSSSKPEDKEAIKYNMDLSYQRARSIFSYILDERSMNFEHQKDLLPMMKVSGRSFLEVLNVNRGVASGEDFCKVNDCKKAQRVIIRFGMDGKK
ncbi:MAG: microtubule-binding protein, partial [Pseudobdellovibrionaceae bacterium]